MHYRIQNWVSRPNINDFRHPTWTYHKVFGKNALKMREKWGGKLFFPTLMYDSRSQFRPACKKSERNLQKRNQKPPPAFVCKCGHSRLDFFLYNLACPWSMSRFSKQVKLWFRAHFKIPIGILLQRL